MGTDAADGVMRLREGELDVAWSHRRSRRMFREMERLMKEISEAAGGRYVTSPLWRWPLRKLLTAHPLGGCRIGDDPERSVANHCGEVWGYPGLYVADGAAIPTALSVNPSLTISAVAARVAQWIVHERDMTSRDDGQVAA
jgi:cholesterol oxidase